MPRISLSDSENYQSSLNGEWFSLKNDKDVARVQFMMNTLDDLDVFACHRVKIGDKERYVDCLRTYDEPIDKCPFCAAGIPVKPVHFVIMYQHDDNKVKIWERGRNFIAKLQSLCNRYQPLSEYVFEIERNGKAGDMATRYEIYPMDRVDPVDLTEIEKPELLGGVILQKTAEEMEVYLDTGSFPAIEDIALTEPQPIRRGDPAARRTEEPAPAPRGSVSRGGISRRGAPAVHEEDPAPARGPARSSWRGMDKEVF